MKDKIKTLKDLELECHWEYDTLQKLKESAREWIKEIRAPDKLISLNGQTLDQQTVIWIRHFFNLESQGFRRDNLDKDDLMVVIRNEDNV